MLQAIIGENFLVTNINLEEIVEVLILNQCRAFIKREECHNHHLKKMILDINNF